jgi:hypothetical protein
MFLIEFFELIWREIVVSPGFKISKKLISPLPSKATMNIETKKLRKSGGTYACFAIVTLTRAIL